MSISDMKMSAQPSCKPAVYTSAGYAFGRSVRIQPAPLSGAVQAVSFKSEAHRYLILSALSDRETVFTLHGGGDDIDATMDCIRALGADILKNGDEYTVIPGAVPGECVINARESGTTMRLMLPVAAALCRRVRFEGAGRLPERPLTHLVNALSQNGVAFSRDKLPFEITGPMKSGVYTVPGNISSQYVSGLLMALAFLPGPSEIIIEGRLASKAYVDMTLEICAAHGIRPEPTQTGYKIAGHGGEARFTPKSVGRRVIAGDWSNAAFFLVAGAICKSKVHIPGLQEVCAQADQKIIAFLNRFGARAYANADGGFVEGGALRGADIDIDESPDLIAPLGILAAYAEGKSVFYNAKRLRYKESDRIESMKNLILSLGGRAEATEDTLTVYGNGALPGGECSGENDHRIVMAAAVAGANSKNGCIIRGADAVKKSYPAFFEDFKSLGGKADVL